MRIDCIPSRERRSEFTVESGYSTRGVLASAARLGVLRATVQYDNAVRMDSILADVGGRTHVLVPVPKVSDTIPPSVTQHGRQRRTSMGSSDWLEQAYGRMILSVLVRDNPNETLPRAARRQPSSAIRASRVRAPRRGDRESASNENQGSATVAVPRKQKPAEGHPK